MNTLRIGMAGLDTSHVSAFANLLHDPTNEHHLPGARITAAFSGGSTDFELSINRVEGFTAELRDRHDVEIVDSLAALKGKCDAVMLESIDGRVHSAEMLFAAMGTGCRDVLALREDSHDLVAGRWSDGRIGTLRGNRLGNSAFGGTLHRKTGSVFFDVSKGSKPYYASLLEKVIPFFRGESEVVPMAETVEVICFLEAANQSALSGKRISL